MIFDHDSDELFFVEEAPVPGQPVAETTGWQILIVDDDPEIHSVTKLVLSDFNYLGRPLIFHQAYSAQQAKEILNQIPDISLVFLDVVMENDHAGLEVVKYIREELDNDLIRIILRTGQPGQAPEEQIIIQYDINDYREKSELSSIKLKSSVITALRTYEDLVTIVDLNANLEEKITARTKQLNETNRLLQEKLKKISEDEEAGKSVQRQLLPPDDWCAQHYRFNFRLLPSLYLSGDFIDYFQPDDDHLVFYLVDVAGHGASAAFITILIKSYFQRLIHEHQQHPQLLSPLETIKGLNLFLLNHHLNKHATIFYGLIDLKHQQLHYLNAGHYPFPLIISEGEPTLLASKSFPVGLFKQAQYQPASLPLPDQFTFCCFSDGVLELIEENHETQEAKLADWAKNELSDLDQFLSQPLFSRTEFPDDITIFQLTKETSPYDTHR